MDSNSIKMILTNVFNTLDQEIAKYTVMNKYDVLPLELPSDIDICVEKKDFINLDKTILKVAKNANLLVVQKIWHNYQKCAYILSPSNISERFRLQLDFFSDFSVKNTPMLIPYQEMIFHTRNHGRYTVPSFGMEFVFLAMRRIYKNDFDEEHCRELQNILNNDIQAINSYSYKYFGIENSKKLISYLLNNDIGSIQRLRPKLWKDLKSFSRKNARFVYAIKYWITQIYRALNRIYNPVGISIAFLSPDGGGKSTIIKSTIDLSWGAFHGNRTFYMRPHLIKNPGHYNVLNRTEESQTNPDPHGKKLHNPVKSLLRFLFYNLDYILGTWLKIIPLKIKKNLVIFDRYYYDYYVDLKRYQYNLPKWLPKAFVWCIPKPDMVFVLDAEPEVLYSRKQELPFDELTRQVAEYRKIGQRLKNAYIIDASQPIEKVTEDVTRKILLYKAGQTAKLMRIRLDENGVPL